MDVGNRIVTSLDDLVGMLVITTHTYERGGGFGSNDHGVGVL